MAKWKRNPFIYEISTWVWLQELSQANGKRITLGNVPGKEWDKVASLCPDAVWFMGVWERSPAGIRVANTNPGLLADFRQALPDFVPEDNVGSPYCVKRYRVDDHLGGPEGLAEARQQLSHRGINLVLDYVPNHVAPDHPWATAHPEYFIQGTREDLQREPAAYLEIGKHVIACGKDPFFPAWPDVLQLNAFNPGLRKAATETVADIASQCDGMRCDMAMLLLNSVFQRTWGERAGTKPNTEYWTDLIKQVKQKHPGVLFIAEAYWDMEWELQQNGFDYCYDKRLYDRLEHDNAESARLHLLADMAYQEKLVRFIENHDEPRAAKTFPPDKERAAAIVVTTQVGARLVHEGQLEGRKVRLPVFLGRRPTEPVDEPLRAFYQKLLGAIDTDAIREGEWRLCERAGWPDNSSYQNLVTWCWRKADDRYLIAVNLSGQRSQGLVKVPWMDMRGQNWRMQDVLSGEGFERDGNQMVDPGMFVDLGAWGAHFLKVAAPS